MRRNTLWFSIILAAGALGLAYAMQWNGMVQKWNYVALNSTAHASIAYLRKTKTPPKNVDDLISDGILQLVGDKVLSIGPGACEPAYVKCARRVRLTFHLSVADYCIRDGIVMNDRSGVPLRVVDCDRVDRRMVERLNREIALQWYEAMSSAGDESPSRMP